MSPAEAEEVRAADDAAARLQVDEEERRDGDRADAGGERAPHRCRDRAQPHAADLELFKLHCRTRGQRPMAAYLDRFGNSEPVPARDWHSPKD